MDEAQTQPRKRTRSKAAPAEPSTTKTRSKAVSTVVETPAVTVPPLTSIDVPIAPMMAALACASAEESRSYLNGIFVHAVDGSTRLVATDGHRLFVYSLPMLKAEAEVPEWLQTGVIVPRELLKERLMLLGKLDNITARLAFATGAAHVVLSDPAESCLFRLPPIDGSFPDYRRILDDAKVFEARELTDMASIAYKGKHLKGVGDIAKQLGSDSVQLFGGALDGEPSLITFPEAPGALLVLMPMKQQKEIAPETVKLISGAVNLTIAALKAHQTRWRERGEKSSSAREKAECEAKVAEYEARIAAIVAQINPPVALPKPEESEDETETTGEFPETSVPVTGDDIDGKQAARATARSRLKSAARKDMVKRFTADINAALSRDHGTTLSQLADGVPVEGWFDAGLTAEEAATRCNQWVNPVEKPEPAAEAQLPGTQEAEQPSEPAPEPQPAVPLRKRSAKRQPATAAA